MNVDGERLQVGGQGEFQPLVLVWMDYGTTLWVRITNHGVTE